MSERPEQSTPEEVIAEILGRWSVTDLHEQSDADLDRADEQFHASKTDVQIVDQGAHGAIKWWKLTSGPNEYEVRRFKNFAFCSCKGFFFNKRACKHISATARVKCASCNEMSATVGKFCYNCHSQQATFLKPTPKPSKPLRPIKF